MDPITLYRLGQLRHQEIVARAIEDTSIEKTPALNLSRRIGQTLLAWGVRLVKPSSCANITTHSGYTVSVCAAPSA